MTGSAECSKTTMSSASHSSEQEQVSPMDVMNYHGFRFRNPKDKEVAVSDTVYDTALSHLLWMWKNEIWRKKWCRETINILDARRRNLKFEQTGFTLVRMDQPSATTNWHDSDDITKFQEEVRPKILELYPGASRVEFSKYSSVRGGDNSRQPLIDGPHLDFSQDDVAREEFHKEFPPPKAMVHQAILGALDTDDEEMRTVVGIWKPINMSTPVGDYPFVVMDASTFTPECERPLKVHTDFDGYDFHSLNGTQVYSPEQRWYYYPFQTQQEVFIFTQYTKGRHFCNPHGSFMNPHAPESFDTRVSIDMRAVVFYPKEKKNES